MKRKSKTRSLHLDAAEEMVLYRHKRLWAEKLLKQADRAEAKAKRLRSEKDYVGAKRNAAHAAELFQDGSLLLAEVESHTIHPRRRRCSVVCQ